MDPEYTVIGRVARRIWAIAMRDRYGANERSQKLKYHVQTSGRSLHAQEMSFNDIRTTLQALCAIYDNANSLHTNAYDEAVTTPTAESVRRALAIQLIINREWGLAAQREPAPGQLHRRGAHRPGRGGGARRARPDQRAGRRARGHGDRLPAGPHPGRVHALRARASTTARCPSSASTPSSHPAGDGPSGDSIELARSTEEEKRAQLARLPGLHTSATRPTARPPSTSCAGWRSSGGNIFAELMTTVRHATPGRDHRDPVRGGRPLPAQRLSGPLSRRPGRRAASDDPSRQACGGP